MRPVAVRVLVALVVVALAWQAYRWQFPEQDKDLRVAVREGVTAQFPELAEQYARGYGIARYPGTHPTAAGRDVLLVHGLDDPGRVWSHMAPALAAAGHRVWILTYPNDQPIAASARFLAQELGRLHETEGVATLDIVAHSMGGLVAREMLSAPDLPCAQDGCRQARVASLTMVGTPNQGSELARFRGFAELREQTVKLFDDEFNWLGFVLDGAGEAGIDLTPGSEFLTRLNARPLPAETVLVVVAGVLGDAERRRLRDVLAGVTPYSEVATDWLDRVSEHLGDGLVSLESARLPGVPLCRVTGTHLSIVRNLISDSTRVPPAVPLALHLLDPGAPGLPTGCR